MAVNRRNTLDEEIEARLKEARPKINRKKDQKKRSSDENIQLFTTWFMMLLLLFGTIFGTLSALGWLG